MADQTYQTKIYEEQGGNTLVVAAGGAINIDGGALQYGGTPQDAVKSGAYTAVAGDATAHSAAIPTGLTTVTSFMVQILRSGAVVTADAAVSEAAGSITVADGGATYAVTAGDVINWIATGTV